MSRSENQTIILLADDDPDDSDLFREAIEIIDGGVTCYLAKNGSETLQKLDELENKPQLIFLDINMPVVSGWQCLTQLKRHDSYKDIPIIIYSTSSHQREIALALELGAICFFTKPSDFLQLKKILGIILANLGERMVESIRNINDADSRALLHFN